MNIGNLKLKWFRLSRVSKLCLKLLSAKKNTEVQLYQLSQF